MTIRKQILGRYRYDALDKVAAFQLGAEKPRQRFYQRDNLTTELGEDSSQSIFQHNNQILALQLPAGSVSGAQLLATDRPQSVLHGMGFGGSVAHVYSPYGHRRASSGSENLPGYNGERIEPVTGLYLLGNGHRAFSPVLMRFNRPDPLSPFSRGGLNSYGYCVGDPVNHTDPTGGEADHTWQTWVYLGMSILGVFGALGGAGGAVLGWRSRNVVSVPASKPAASRALVTGIVGAGLGVVTTGVGLARNIAEVVDDDNAAEDFLVAIMGALSVLTVAAGAMSMKYAWQAHKLNRIAAQPGTPPPQRGSSRASATVRRDSPVGTDHRPLTSTGTRIRRNTL